jgi:hypothetical protein
VYKAKTKTRKRTKRELLSQKENSCRITLEEILEVHRRRLMPKKLNIRRGTKLGKKIRTLISFPKGVINHNISLFQFFN